MSHTTTTDLRPGTKIAYCGIVREVDGIRPDASWNFGPGKQPWVVVIRPVPGGGRWDQRPAAGDAIWEVLEPEAIPGELVAFRTPTTPAEPVVWGRSYAAEDWDHAADERADYEFMQRIGER